MNSTQQRLMNFEDLSNLLPDVGKKSGGVESETSQDWTRFGKKQILSVGKKNEVLRYNEEDELAVNDGYNSSSDEDDGRTAAVKERKKPNKSVALARATTYNTAMNGGKCGATSEKKKKKKKKLNKMTVSTIDNNATIEEASRVFIIEDQSNVSKGDAHVVSNDPHGHDVVTKVEEPQSEAISNKKKRKKVRSRQKNIRKDTRAENVKPSHLIVGSDTYCGRPITKETRLKLGIQPTAKDNAKLLANSGNDIFHNEVWVGEIQTSVTTDNLNVNERNPKTMKPTATTLTKIGDCIVNDGSKVDADSGHLLSNHSISTSMHETRKKMQKRKFKNFLVG